MATGSDRPPDLPSSVLQRDLTHDSGSVRGAVKPITSMALSGLPSDWLRAGGSHDVQSSLTTDAQQQDEYPTATDPLLTYRLTEESIPVG
jgi:hypothetical protein